ncbi:hypothetical protein MRX96_034187 [Rhipicephalus microplus]
MVKLEAALRPPSACTRLQTAPESDPFGPSDVTRLSHMVLLVHLGADDRYIIDAGIARLGLSRALPVAADATPFRVRVMDALNTFEVALPTSESGWKAMYVIKPYDLN